MGHDTKIRRREILTVETEAQVTFHPFASAVKKRSKYGVRKNDRNRDFGGYRYDSGMEAGYAALLEMMKKAVNPKDRVVKWERQIKMELTAHGVHICNHYVDFRVWFADGHDEYHEVKGWPNEVYPIKRKMMLAQWPNICYRVFESKGGEYIEKQNFSRPR